MPLVEMNHWWGIMKTVVKNGLGVRATRQVVRMWQAQSNPQTNKHRLVPMERGKG